MVEVRGKANGLILDLKSLNVKDGALLFVSWLCLHAKVFAPHAHWSVLVRGL